MRLHADEVPAGVTTARALIRQQRPEWAELPLITAGSGTDNTMYRLGSELLVRLPRTPQTARAIDKEQTWLPRLAPRLPLTVPEPVHRGQPTEDFPHSWSVYRWIDGAEVDHTTIGDWTGFAADLVGFIRALRELDLMGARPADDLHWYRGGPLAATTDWIGGCFETCRERDQRELDLDLDRLQRLWLDALNLPEPTQPQGWLHGDLKPSNLLARDGRLHAVIDFGTLSIGYPAAEHAPVWDLPEPARHAYWQLSGIDEPTWLRARAWSIAVGISGVSYYWTSNPGFVQECLIRLRAILADSG